MKWETRTSASPIYALQVREHKIKITLREHRRKRLKPTNEWVNKRLGINYNILQFNIFICKCVCVCVRFFEYSSYELSIQFSKCVQFSKHIAAVNYYDYLKAYQPYYDTTSISSDVFFLLFFFGKIFFFHTPSPEMLMMISDKRISI